MYGVTVHIDDKLCGVVDKNTPMEPFQGTNGYGSSRKEGNGFRVICDDPIVGSSVTVSTKRIPKETDIYQAGLTLCDIRVWNTEREPTFENAEESLEVAYENTKMRWDWNKPLSETKLG